MANDRFVPLVASEALHADATLVAELLAADPPWPGLVALPSAAAGMRRYETDLRLPVGGDAVPVTFSKAAFLDLGTPQRTDGRWRVEVGWRASTAAPLFPVFSGWLIIGTTDLRIEGLYAPPGRAIGRLADRVLLHTAANGTARWLLREIDRVARDSGDLRRAS